MAHAQMTELLVLYKKCVQLLLQFYAQITIVQNPLMIVLTQQTAFYVLQVFLHVLK